MPHHRIVIGSAGASGIFQQAQHGMFANSEHSARLGNRIAFYQGRYDLAPFGCVQLVHRRIT
jgi:hypothetical protein